MDMFRYDGETKGTRKKKAIRGQLLHLESVGCVSPSSRGFFFFWVFFFWVGSNSLSRFNFCCSVQAPTTTSNGEIFFFFLLSKWIATLLGILFCCECPCLACLFVFRFSLCVCVCVRRMMLVFYEVERVRDCPPPMNANLDLNKSQ